MALISSCLGEGSLPTAAAVPGGKAAVPAGFVPALPSSPPGTGKGQPRGQGMGASVGSSAWVCPFKWSCLLSSFGTQPLSCLRLQRQRIKGLFYLNETLSPTSWWMVDSRVLLDSGVLASLLGW